MESFTLDVVGKEKGILLQNKTFLPISGPVLKITNSSSNNTISFVHASWNKSDSEIVAGDNLGNIYIFYLQKARFSLIYRLKICSSCLTFSPDHTQNILVALANCTIVSIDSKLKIVKNTFTHHESSVFNISFDLSGETVLSCSKDQAILWNLQHFQILKLLNLKKNVDLVKACFFPNKDIILSAFNDNTVYLWNFIEMNCISQFICHAGDQYLNLKTIDVSRDGKYMVCAGKSNWIYVWDTEVGTKVNTIALLENVNSVKQISFLPSLPDLNIYALCLLSSDGEIFIYDIQNISLLHKVSSDMGKIVSLACSFNFHQFISISLGTMELYDVEDFVMMKYIGKIPHKRSSPTSPVHKTVRALKKKEEKKKTDLNLKRLNFILKNFEEYPEKHRFFIWSQLLKLPRNEEAFKMLYQESLQVQIFIKECSFMNPGVQKTFLRIMSMLSCWHPLIREMDYIQCVIFPFVKILHKNTIMCFELIVTLISNWCQNWFLFCPFPPFNILCAVENIILFHDQELMAYFMKKKISAELYAWSLLKTSFSEVFNKNEWMKFWDNVFTNPLSFYLYAVAAFNIVVRPVLLQCKTIEQFKSVYQKHSVTASMVLKKTYELQTTSPKDIHPETILGKFSPIPKDLYPTFFQMSRIKLDLETLERKKIIEQEIDFIKQREDCLEIKSNYLLELQKLQLVRRDLLLESLQLKDTDSLRHLHEKLTKVQNLIQENLTEQIGMLKEKIGEEILYDDVRDPGKHYFEFQDYIKKLRRMEK